MGADYATRREPSRLREPIAHHVNIREAAPEALSTLSLPNIRFSTVQHAQRHASADPPILRVIVYRISTACSICSFAMVA
jgi:hypothetical protein